MPVMMKTADATRAQVEAYMSHMPKDRMLVLDLISEATPAYEDTHFYHGLPMLWSTLHNFGGQIGLRGNLPTVMKRPYQARDLPGISANKGLLGVIRSD